MNPPDPSSSVKTSAASTLDYAPRSKASRRWIRRTVLFFTFVGIAIATWHLGPATVRQAKILWWQHQCMTYIAPAEMVVYEEEPVAAGKLRTNDPHYTPYRLAWIPGTQSQFVMGADFKPACWQRYEEAAGPLIDYTIDNASQQWGAVIFMHERISKSGNRRLVFVQYSPGQASFEKAFQSKNYCRIYVILPATITHPAMSVANLADIETSSDPSMPQPVVRVYAGQADHENDDHFTIRYEMWGQTDTLDALLGDDDQVTLKPRDPPKPQPKK